MLPDPMDSLTEVDLPNEGLIHLAETCGLDAVKELLRRLPGQSFVAPKNGLKRVQEAADRRGKKEGQPFIAEDFPSGTWRFIAERCGVDVMLKIFEHAPNIPIAVPKQALIKVLHRFIAEHYNGSNEYELAIHLGVSRTTFYQLMNQPLKPREGVEKDRLQVSMFP